MSMSRQDWYERYYRPLPANVRLVHVDHRDQHIMDTLERVKNLHSFGQMLYHDVIAKREGGKPFTGYPNWFATAIAKGWIPKPNKPFPVATVNQALLIYNGHTMQAFGVWSAHAKMPTITSYLAYLRRRDVTISLVPITDPFTREAMGSRARA
jgi:hypothetical protein